MSAAWDIVDSTAWSWRPFKSALHDTDGFWIGEDPTGARWVTKMRGSFRGYRELVFGRLMQQAGWECLDSAFTVLDKQAPPMVALPHAEQTQLISRFLEEHSRQPCGPACPSAEMWAQLGTAPVDQLGSIARSGVAGAKSLVRCEILAYVLGGIEPSGWLLTIDHRIVLIDGELMFASLPTDPRESAWWSHADGSAYAAGRRLTHEVCAAIGALADADVEAALAIPVGIEINMHERIRLFVFAARDQARAFAQHGA